MMNAKTRTVLKLALVVAAVAALVPTAALARPLFDEFDGWWGFRGWGSTGTAPTGTGPAGTAPAWCHTGDFGVTALSDRATLGRIAGALGLAPTRLSARLSSGDTVADIAAERGINLGAAVDAALARHRDIVRWRVEDGLLTQNQADRTIRLMEEQIRTAFGQGAGRDLGPGLGFGEDARFRQRDDFGGYGGPGGYGSYGSSDSYDGYGSSGGYRGYGESGWYGLDRGSRFMGGGE